ncbi:hypothetical protein NHX12_013675 [Muraenolepis orangiensis]|uniref:Uncharacterized protein n=1 Tax=Muraenolepis orangiensis TaxID=630683 RepID=A0A9Q0I319_9TELE|nr:hypothetical protein NHX12_013675 [Muraenolepis orangiensis]
MENRRNLLSGRVAAYVGGEGPVGMVRGGGRAHTYLGLIRGNLPRNVPTVPWSAITQKGMYVHIEKPDLLGNDPLPSDRGRRISYRGGDLPTPGVRPL